MRIAVDAMGSDNHPDAEVQAVAQAAAAYPDDIFLVGPEKELSALLNTLPGDHKNIHLVDASDVITMQDKGLALALKAKRKGSKTTMAVGMDLITTNQVDAFLTGGNTGGVVATAFFRLGMIPGVERPAATGLFPTKEGYCAVLDIGANPEVKPEHLLQFAIMGMIYCKALRKVDHPRVALLSNGEEPGKGNELVKHAYPLLQASGLNFIGNVEAKEIFNGEADVVVTDGFSGNIFLKTSEAAAKFLTDTLKKEITGSTRTKIGGLLAKPAFDVIKRMLDPSEVGAAPLLGVNGLVFKAHGRSDARAILNGYRTLRQAVEANLLSQIKEAIQNNIQVAPSQADPDLSL